MGIDCSWVWGFLFGVTQCSKIDGGAVYIAPNIVKTVYVK